MKTHRSWLAAMGVISAAMSVARAHPAVGIVADRAGNVYFSDLKQIWRISTDGAISVAVPDVHTHELYLDEKGDLYGEHLWYDDRGTDKWHYRVWRLRHDGRLETVVAERTGSRTEHSFVRDRGGATYVLDGGQPRSIVKRDSKGTAVLLARGELRDPGWIAVTPRGVVYFLDEGALKVVGADGHAATVVARLSSLDPAPDRARERHYHMGLWLDADERVYVAIPEERAVVRVGRRGDVAVVARSSEGWRPSGGTIDSDRSLWILEYDDRNRVRARCLPLHGAERVYAPPGG